MVRIARSIAESRSRLTDQTRLMYPPGGDRFTAAIPAAGGAPVALAAAERARSQRSARGRAVRAGRPAPEPGLVPPASAARRGPGLDASQHGRRPRHLLRP